MSKRSEFLIKHLNPFVYSLPPSVEMQLTMHRDIEPIAIIVDLRQYVEQVYANRQVRTERKAWRIEISREDLVNDNVVAIRKLLDEMLSKVKAAEVV